MRHDVVRDDDVGSLALGDEALRKFHPEELLQGGYAGGACGGGLVRGRVDAEDGDAALDEVAQEIAVVARDLDDEAVGSQVSGSDEVERVTAGVREQVVREGREVEVVVDEELLGRHLAEDLDK